MSKQSSQVINSKLQKLLANTGDMALKRRAMRIIQELDPMPGDKILEVGCGDGFYMHIISNLNIKNVTLTGIDNDKHALNAAKKNLKGHKVTLRQADLMVKLPFTSNSFNKIIMSEVAEHLPDDVKGFKEVYRVLKKEGKLIVTVPNHNYPLLWDPVNWILERTFNTHIREGFWAGLWNKHLRLYKPQQLRKKLQKAGYVVNHIESMTWWCLPFNHNLMHLAARKLYGGELSPEMAKAVSKYEVSMPKRPILITGAFQLVNSIDKLNNILQPKNHGVGVLAVAKK